MSTHETLETLIARRKGPRSFAVMAEETNGDLSPARIHALASRGLANSDGEVLGFPGVRAINALAKVLGVSAWEIFLAMGYSAGLKPPSSDAPLALRLPAGIENLDDEFVDLLLTLIRREIGRQSSE